MTKRALCRVRSASPSSRSVSGAADSPGSAALAASAAAATPGPPAPTTTLPSSFDRYRPGWAGPARAGSRVSGKMRRKDRRVPMAGEGTIEGSAETSRWVSSRRVQVGQV